MFENCSSLLIAPQLNGTKFAVNSCANMFKNCTSLTGIYNNVFTFNETAINCCSSMFENCTSLTSSLTSISLLDKTLAAGAYASMFKGCTSLNQAPTLLATALADNCYTEMFKGCTSLITAPTLLATKLASGCYTEMFAGCTNLNSMSVKFTAWPTDGSTKNWLSGVSKAGTFRGPAALQQTEKGPDTYPEGWAFASDV